MLHLLMDYIILHLYTWDMGDNYDDDLLMAIILNIQEILSLN